MEKVKYEEIRILEKRFKKQVETLEKEILGKKTKIKVTTRVLYCIVLYSFASTTRELENVKHIAHKEAVQLKRKNETIQLEKKFR